MNQWFGFALNYGEKERPLFASQACQSRFNLFGILSTEIVNNHFPVPFVSIEKAGNDGRIRRPPGRTGSSIPGRVQQVGEG